MIRNILFDWSGTLVDDLPAVLRATNFVFEQAGMEQMTLDQFRAEFCLPFKKFYDRHTPGVPMEQLEMWFHARFKQTQDDVVPLPHARRFLEFARRHHIRMFVLSTVHADHFASQAATTGFGRFFERTYLGVPDKEAQIGSVLRDNHLNPQETLFIGDMQHDIDAARHGGVYSCAVLTGYTGLELLRASKPDLIVEHLGELQDLLEQQQWTVRPPAERPIATVGAFIFNDAGQLLLLRTHKWSNLWGIPGGKIRFGESSMDALRRELKEETNLDVTEIRFVLVQDCIHSTEFYRDAHFILLNYTCRCGSGAGVRLNEEAQEFRWVTLAEAEAFPLNTPTRRLLEAIIKDTPHQP